MFTFGIDRPCCLHPCTAHIHRGAVQGVVTEPQVCRSVRCRSVVADRAALQSHADQDDTPLLCRSWEAPGLHITHSCRLTVLLGNSDCTEDLPRTWLQVHAPHRGTMQGAAFQRNEVHACAPCCSQGRAGDCWAPVADTNADSILQQPTDLRLCPAAGHAGGHSPLGLPGELVGVLCWQPAQHCHICWASGNAIQLASTQCHVT